MDVASLLLACSLHADDELLRAMAYAQGGSASVYRVENVHLGVLTSQDEPLSRPRSNDVALAEIARITDAGGTPVIGLLPVRLDWAEKFGEAPAELVEPCTNVAVASAQISAFDYECRFEGPRATSPSRRACTLNRYAASVGLPGLPRAVLARLTIGSSLDALPLLELELADAPEPASELFFTLEPLAPAPTLEPSSPPLPPRSLPKLGAP